MNELQIVNVNAETMMVSARELYKALEIKYDFKRWIDSNLKNFIENIDFFRGHIHVMANRHGGSQTIDDYSLTMDTAKHLCLMSHTEKGRECRQYLIDLEKAWNSPEQVMARALKLADKAIAELTERNTALIADNERMKPKEIFADAVAASDNAILVREFAKMIRQNGIEIGEKRLYKWLRTNGYICQNSTEPTQKAMEQCLFEVMERTIQRGDQPPRTVRTTKITGKGQVVFANKLIGEETQ